MRPASLFVLLPSLALLSTAYTIRHASTGQGISPQLFDELDELARVVDISYCVGFTGIQSPFSCAGHCDDFPSFELIQTWNTGPLLSDSCGYIAYDHAPARPRIIVAFRGTYSIASTIADLSTIPQKYVPYPSDPPSGSSLLHTADGITKLNTTACMNCTVHSGFLRSWLNTRSAILPAVSLASSTHPDYALTLVGHSLGGAVALLAGLELHARGTPAATITTFGEPKVGNDGFVAHVDTLLVQSREDVREESTYRRLTHIDDPVPLLPLTEWGYVPHAGELYISKASLPASILDVQPCEGDRDSECSAGTDGSLASLESGDVKEMVLVPSRFNLWQLFFAHRDYFTRLGVCIKRPLSGVIGESPLVLEPWMVDG